jgi:hypothetical protein
MKQGSSQEGFEGASDGEMFALWILLTRSLNEAGYAESEIESLTEEGEKIRVIVPRLEIVKEE